MSDYMKMTELDDRLNDYVKARLEIVLRAAAKNATTEEEAEALYYILGWAQHYNVCSQDFCSTIYQVLSKQKELKELLK